MTRTFARRMATVGGALTIAVLAGIGTAAADTTTDTAGSAGVATQQDSGWWKVDDHNGCNDQCGRPHDECDNQCNHWTDRSDCDEHHGLLDWLLGALL